MFSIRKEKSPILYLFFFTERNERERSKNWKKQFRLIMNLFFWEKQLNYWFNQMKTLIYGH
jgi:hypothetical protein